VFTQHKDRKALITDALHEVKNPSRFGVVQLDADKSIRRFVEKPKPKQAPSCLVNAGIYLMEPDVLQVIAPDRKVSLEREIFPALAKQRKLSGFPFSGHWFDIGNLTDYRRANFTLLRDPTRAPAEDEKGMNRAKDAVVRKPVLLGQNSKLESKVLVGPGVLLGNGDRIQSNARVSNSILFDRVTIGEGSDVSGAIIATDVKVGNNAKIGRGCIISPGVKIGDDVKVGAGAIIHPYKEIDRNIRAGSHVM
jgi:mannose-1-phosphate guanylyltransferase